MAHFQMKDLGELENYPWDGNHQERPAELSPLVSPSDIDKILERFRLEKANPMPTFLVNHNLSMLAAAGCRKALHVFKSWWEASCMQCSAHGRPCLCESRIPPRMVTRNRAHREAWRQGNAYYATSRAHENVGLTLGGTSPPTAEGYSRLLMGDDQERPMLLTRLRVHSRQRSNQPVEPLGRPLERYPPAKQGWILPLWQAQ